MCIDQKDGQVGATFLNIQIFTTWTGSKERWSSVDPRHPILIHLQRMSKDYIHHVLHWMFGCGGNDGQERWRQETDKGIVSCDDWPGMSCLGPSLLSPNHLSLISLYFFFFCLWLRFSSNLPPNTRLVFSCSYFTPVKEKSCPSPSLELAQPGTSPSPPSPWYSEPHLRNKKSCLYSADGKSSIFLPIIIYIFLVRLLLHIYILTLHKCVVLYWYWLALEV